jgi:uncharacterized membrane protein
MARDIVVAAFDSRNQAYEAAREIQLLSEVVVQSGAIVEKDQFGNVTTLDTQNVGGPWGTIGGLAGGALVGALIGLLAGPGGAAVGSAAGAAAAGTGAVAGSVVGGTAGWSADLLDWGLKHDAIDEISDMVLSGKTAVVAEVDEGSTEPIDAAVRRHGGVVFRRPITL